MDQSTGKSRPVPPGDSKSSSPRPMLSPGSPGQYRVSPLSWLVFLLLIAWNLWSFYPKSMSDVALPYSAFVAQVTAANVSRARIVGDQISGTFAHSITWPDAETPSPVDKAVSKPGGKGAETKSPRSYATFQTTVPSVVGDASLVPLLEAHHVVIDVATPSPPWFTILLTDGLPVLLLGLLFVWMGRQAALATSRAATHKIAPGLRLRMWQALTKVRLI